MGIFLEDSGRLPDRIIAFALAEDDIRAVILEGSLAAGVHSDELSDYDINIFSRDIERYLSDDGWMSQIGDVLLYQKEHLDFYGEMLPSRLVLFRSQPRVDFSFWPVALLSEIILGKKVYESYRNGYQILVDKDHVAGQLPPADASGFTVVPPGRDEFLQTVYDFWFEAYCVAKYLARGDLWFAKLIENRYIKDHLFSMALWHHQAARGWAHDPILHLEGKRFEKWAAPELVEAVSACFSGYEIEDTWSSLFAMLELFQRLARETSSQLGFKYPERVERDVASYLQHIKQISQK